MAPPRAPALLRLAPHLVLGAFCAGLAGALAVTIPGGPAAVGTVGCALGAAAARGARAGDGGAPAAGRGGGSDGPGLGADSGLRATAPPALDLPQSASGPIVVDAPPAPDGRGGLRARAVVERMALRRRHGRARGHAHPAGRWTTPTAPSAPGGPPRRGRAPASRVELGVARLVARRGWSAAASPPASASATGAPEGRRGGPRGGQRDGWRRWAADGAAAGLGGDRAALVRGMALGGGSGLSEAAAQAFRDAGLWHLLAVSRSERGGGGRRGARAAARRSACAGGSRSPARSG